MLRHLRYLSQVEPTIALYLNPDDVVLLSTRSEMKFDGIFIGACTTTDEDLILAGLILQAGLAKGLPMVPGKRHVVPGSLPIVERLREIGLLDVYEAAGFSRGPPGCSYCVGMAEDQAGKANTGSAHRTETSRTAWAPVPLETLRLHLWPLHRLSVCR